MAETPTSPPEKGRKNRSLGAFLLFLTVLLTILVIVGGDQWQPTKKLTQDQFEWHLHRGHVEVLNMQGENTIVGTFTEPLGEDGPEHFSVTLEEAYLSFMVARDRVDAARADEEGA